MPRVSKGTRVNRRTKPQKLPKTFRPGFLANLDGRTELAKALLAYERELVEDLGGEAELSHAKRALVQRFVFLEAIVQTLEQEIASGNSESLGKWTQAVNALSGLASKLGIERKAKQINWAQLTPTLPEKSNGKVRNGLIELPGVEDER